jgi:hypothetical protein
MRRTRKWLAFAAMVAMTTFAAGCSEGSLAALHTSQKVTAAPNTATAPAADDGRDAKSQAAIEAAAKQLQAEAGAMAEKAAGLAQETANRLKATADKAKAAPQEPKETSLLADSSANPAIGWPGVICQPPKFEEGGAATMECTYGLPKPGKSTPEPKWLHESPGCLPPLNSKDGAFTMECRLPGLPDTGKPTNKAPRGKTGCSITQNKGVLTLKGCGVDGLRSSSTCHIFKDGTSVMQFCVNKDGTITSSLSASD